MNRPIQAINEILNLKKVITPMTALQLAAALDINANWLLDQQNIYLLSLCRVNALEIRERSIELQMKKGEMVA